MCSQRKVTYGRPAGPSSLFRHFLRSVFDAQTACRFRSFVLTPPPSTSYRGRYGAAGGDRPSSPSLSDLSSLLPFSCLTEKATCCSITNRSSSRGYVRRPPHFCLLRILVHVLYAFRVPCTHSTLLHCCCCNLRSTAVKTDSA